MEFKDIIGNEKAKQILLKTVKNKTVLHSYMFIGNEGIGKSLIAKQFAKMILCENFNEQNLEPCGKCKSCIEFDGDNNPDFKCIEPDGKIIKVEQIREMQSKIIEKPIISNKKVYVINDADLMRTEAQNCFLKTLEEPPEFVVIILIVNNESKILPTIKSRCMKIQFSKIDDEDIKSYLKNNYQINNINQNILNMCDGSIGKAIIVQNRLEEYNQIESIIKNINKPLTTVIKNSEILYKDKEKIYEYLDYINVILYNLTKENSSDSMKYINSIKVVEQTKQRILGNCNYDMCIDRLLFNIWEEINEKNSWS